MKYTGTGLDVGDTKVSSVADATIAGDAATYDQRSVADRSQVLTHNGTSWTTTSDATPDLASSYIYVRDTGDPDPTGSMVAGDILLDLT